MNSLYNKMNTQSNGYDILTEFNKFRQNFKGDPKQMVMNLISNGTMSQETFNELSAQANSILPMIK